MLHRSRRASSSLDPVDAIGGSRAPRPRTASRETGRARRILGAALVGGGLAYLGNRILRGEGEDLTGKVVLITGGSRGLGLLLAKEFAREGCRIAICARDELELQQAQQDLRDLGAPVLTIPCDISDEDQVREMVLAVRDHYGDVDILVNNAGILYVGPIESMTLDDFERAMKVMYWGPLCATMAVLPRMIERRDGRIVNITSIGGKVAVPHLLPYVGAKFGMVGISEGLRAELRKHGVSVTTIVPGLMRTGSPVNAFFKGDAGKEFTWLSLASATPLTAMSAERAARRIVAATRRGEAEVTLTWQAKTLRIGHALFPGAMSDLLGLVNRMLPSGTSRGRHRGMHLATRMAPSPLTVLMNRAAVRNNEFTGRARPTKNHARGIGIDA